MWDIRGCKRERALIRIKLIELTIPLRNEFRLRQFVTSFNPYPGGHSYPKSVENIFIQRRIGHRGGFYLHFGEPRRSRSKPHKTGVWCRIKRGKNVAVLSFVFMPARMPTLNVGILLKLLTMRYFHTDGGGYFFLFMFLHSFFIFSKRSSRSFYQFSPIVAVKSFHPCSNFVLFLFSHFYFPSAVE